MRVVMGLHFPMLWRRCDGALVRIAIRGGHAHIRDHDLTGILLVWRNRNCEFDILAFVVCFRERTKCNLLIIACACLAATGRVVVMSLCALTFSNGKPFYNGVGLRHPALLFHHIIRVKRGYICWLFVCIKNHGHHGRTHLIELIQKVGCRIRRGVGEERHIRP